jgi:hypothetical protein
MGTHWEQLGKNKIQPPPHSPFMPPSLFKRKKLDPFMSACSEIVGHSVSTGHLKVMFQWQKKNGLYKELGYKL